MIGPRIVALVLRVSLAAALVAAAGCRRDSADDVPSGGGGEPGHEAPAPTNRIAVPETVRRNLGVTFARVESRSVAQTIRVPGQFELQPEARREYRTMLSGRVELLVRQFDRVEPGAPLYRLISPEWQELQARLTEAESMIRQTEARVASLPMLLDAHRNHEESLRVTVALWEKRVEELDRSRSSGVVTGEEFTVAQNTLAMQRAELAEVLEQEAELQASGAESGAQHDAAHARFRLLLSTAATLLGTDERSLSAPFDPDSHRLMDLDSPDAPASQPAPAWHAIREIEVRAAAPGVVESLELTSGAWASSGSLVFRTIEPERLRFRAMGLQSDLSRLRDGLPARIVPPKGGSMALQDAMDATLRLGLVADPQERTVELIAAPARLAAWARAGVSAHLEIAVDGGQSELAIPLSCVIQDGLDKIFFRRDPRNPDEVIRLAADLGINDGRWVAVRSGLREGDEVVLDGVYQLMIASSGSVEKGGHFHSDGTFHAGEDGK